MTERRVLTPYRRRLLENLPSPGETDYVARKQINVMLGFGWLTKVGGRAVLTDEGRAELAKPVDLPRTALEGDALLCRRCGARQVVEMPVATRSRAQVVAGWAKVHRYCRENVG